eukprot:6792148-Alexandrium_andersonii.AAC.1
MRTWAAPGIRPGATPRRSRPSSPWSTATAAWGGRSRSSRRCPSASASASVSTASARARVAAARLLAG